VALRGEWKCDMELHACAQVQRAHRRAAQRASARRYRWRWPATEGRCTATALAGAHLSRRPRSSCQREVCQLKGVRRNCSNQNECPPGRRLGLPCSGLKVLSCAWYTDTAKNRTETSMLIKTGMKGAHVLRGPSKLPSPY
jgi:hypothetical protein